MPGAAKALNVFTLRLTSSSISREAVQEVAVVPSAPRLRSAPNALQHELRNLVPELQACHLLLLLYDYTFSLNQ